MKISVCGKGGSGKSTITSLLARQAIQMDLSVLVVDADDSNSGLYRMLGFSQPPEPLMSLVGGKSAIQNAMGKGSLLTRETIKTEDIPSDYIIKNHGMMLVGIGKIIQALEGCACPMGVLNREFLKKLNLDSHEIAIVDMEAGIEHFGRGIDEYIDYVLIVVEPSHDSMVLAEKVNEMAAKLNKKVGVVLNKVPSETVEDQMMTRLTAKGLPIIGRVVQDTVVTEAGLLGNTAAYGSAFEAAGKILYTIMKNKPEV